MTDMPEDIIRAYAAPVPRYTSYPTAPHFHEVVGPELVFSWMASLPETEAISLYLHIPFCDRMCWFCGCHTQHVEKYDPVSLYMETLYKEIALVSGHIGRRQKVARIHLGGGSPSMLKQEDLVALRQTLRTYFDISDRTEISVEFDPTDLSKDDVQSFIDFGVTRASIGVQDFDEKVQRAINRLQTFEQTRDVISQLRAGGVSSVNIDALYGLPFQTEATLETTLSQVVSLRPDRVALFGYAHVPWVKPHQKLIPEDALPDNVERYKQARFAEAYLKRAGFVQIGFDHFAKPDDSLARAARAGALHRNFQGYTADDCKTLIGLGTSSISQFAQGYAQNTKNRHAYKRAFEAGDLAIEKGVELTSDDRVVAAAIKSLLCDFRLDSRRFKAQFGDAATSVLSKCAMIVMRDEDGFFREDEGGFFITEDGRPFARSFVACLDSYLGRNVGRYSVAV
jgi:oxygen-independent coproporphyrinogen-3 oxidase